MSRWVALAALVLSAVACGSAGTSSSPSPAPSPAVSAPASAAVVFKLNGVGTAKTSGTITVTTKPGSLTLELKIKGLQGASIHVSHIHVGSCAGHGNIKFALNPVVADGQGNADARSTLSVNFPPASGSWYVVVHVGPDMVGTNAQYLLCGNLFK